MKKRISKLNTPGRRGRSALLASLDGPRFVVTVLAAVATMFAAQTGAAWAGAIGIQAQANYDLTETRRPGIPKISTGRFFTNYNLMLRRPFLPSSSLVTDLSVNVTGNGDANTSQTNRNWTLNMYSNAPTYMLMGRINRSNSVTSSSSYGSSNGLTTNYSANVFLREPAYPVINAQFLRNVSSSSYAGAVGSYSTTSWITSSYYDMSPLRFSYDRTRQSTDYSKTSNTQQTNQTLAVRMDHTFMTGLAMTGELSKTNTDVTYSTTTSATDTDRQAIRLTATPTRSIVMDVDFTSQSNKQGMGGATTSNKDNSISWDVRSEVFQGLTLDYSDQKQSQTGNALLDTRKSTSRNRNLALAARLGNDSFLSVSKMLVDTEATTVNSDTQQDSLQTSLQTSITRTKDFSVNYGRSNSTSGLGDSYNSSFMSASIRDRTSAKLSTGATYRRTVTHSQSLVGSPFDQVGSAVDMDVIWQPNYDMGLNLRLSYQNNTGTNENKVLSPSANMRWQLDSSTNLTTSYTRQRLKQADPALAQADQNTSGLSLRLTHNFTNGSYMDVSYDLQAYNYVDLEWQKQLRLIFTINL